MELKEALKKINWKQPKYVIPVLIYIPLLVVMYFVVDLFHTEKAEIPDDSMKTTEYLNPELPDAKIKGDGVGNKYESMVKSYGKIDDYSAIDNIDLPIESTFLLPLINLVAAIRPTIIPPNTAVRFI